MIDVGDFESSKPKFMKKKFVLFEETLGFKDHEVWLFFKYHEYHWLVDYDHLSLDQILVNGGLLTLSVAIFSILLIRMRFRLTKKELVARFALEELNNAYVRFVPKAFLDQLEKKDITSVGLGDHKSSYISILFSDIRSFTTMAENMTADETFIFINEYLAELGPVVRKNNGFIDVSNASKNQNLGISKKEKSLL